MLIKSNSEEKINVNPVIASLVFVRSPAGNEVERGKISELTPDRNLLKFPYNFYIRFQNSGNVFVAPYGIMEITDPRGKVVATGILNEGSLDTLPESIRKFNVKIEKKSKFLLPGIYNARLSGKFGKSEQKITAETKFFYRRLVLIL